MFDAEGFCGECWQLVLKKKAESNKSRSKFCNVYLFKSRYQVSQSNVYFVCRCSALLNYSISWLTFRFPFLLLYLFCSFSFVRHVLFVTGNANNETLFYMHTARPPGWAGKDRSSRWPDHLLAWAPCHGGACNVKVNWYDDACLLIFFLYIRCPCEPRLTISIYILLAKLEYQLLQWQ